MEGSQIIYGILGIAIVVFSILTVTSRRILRAAVSLLFVLISTAGLYFMLNYQFLAAVQLTLYAGGIIVLIIFSVLLTSQISHKLEPVGLKKSLFSGLAAIAGAIIVITTILSYSFQADTAAALEVDMKVIGRSLLGTGDNGYVLPFEVISILLVAAMIGAIIVAKKSGIKKQENSKQ